MQRIYCREACTEYVSVCKIFWGIFYAWDLEIGTRAKRETFFFCAAHGTSRKKKFRASRDSQSRDLAAKKNLHSHCCITVFDLISSFRNSSVWNTLPWDHTSGAIPGTGKKTLRRPYLGDPESRGKGVEAPR